MQPQGSHVGEASLRHHLVEPNNPPWGGGGRNANEGAGVGVGVGGGGGRGGLGHRDGVASDGEGGRIVWRDRDGNAVPAVAAASAARGARGGRGERGGDRAGPATAAAAAGNPDGLTLGGMGVGLRRSPDHAPPSAEPGGRAPSASPPTSPLLPASPNTIAGARFDGSVPAHQQRQARLYGGDGGDHGGGGGYHHGGASTSAAGGGGGVQRHRSPVNRIPSASSLPRRSNVSRSSDIEQGAAAPRSSPLRSLLGGRSPNRDTRSPIRDARSRSTPQTRPGEEGGNATSSSSGSANGAGERALSSPARSPLPFPAAAASAAGAGAGAGAGAAASDNVSVLYPAAPRPRTPPPPELIAAALAIRQEQELAQQRGARVGGRPSLGERFGLSPLRGGRQGEGRGRTVVARSTSADPTGEL